MGVGLWSIFTTTRIWCIWLFFGTSVWLSNPNWTMAYTFLTYVPDYPIWMSERFSSILVPCLDSCVTTRTFNSKISSILSTHQLLVSYALVPPRCDTWIMYYMLTLWHNPDLISLRVLFQTDDTSGLLILYFIWVKVMYRILRKDLFNESISLG